MNTNAQESPAAFPGFDALRRDCIPLKTSLQRYLRMPIHSRKTLSSDVPEGELQ